MTIGDLEEEAEEVLEEAEVALEEAEEDPKCIRQLALIVATDVRFPLNP